jgi:hypothetical protein
MPLMTEADPPRKCRAPVWALVLAVVVLPLAGLFGWSCSKPVILGTQTPSVQFGYHGYRNPREPRAGHDFLITGEGGLILVPLPNGYYVATWNIY